MSKSIAIKEENIALHIHCIRDENVMINFDLATLYGAQTRALKQAVVKNYDEKFKIVFDAIRQLIRQEKEPREAIGFKPKGKGVKKP